MRVKFALGFELDVEDTTPEDAKRFPLADRTMLPREERGSGDRRVPCGV